MSSQQTGVTLLGSDSRYRAIVLAGLLSAFLVRLHRLGASSLWYDETVSAHLARQPITDMLAHTALDIHPPAYYLMLHGWSAVSTPFVNQGLEFLLAFPSLWFGVLAIALLVPIGRTVLGKTPTALAVWLAAVHPFLVWYGQEVRMYTVAGALGLLCLLAALRYTSRSWNSESTVRLSSGSVGWLLLYALAAAAGLYTLYYTAFALIAINITVLVSIYLLSRQGERVIPALAGWIIAQTAVLVLFSPWLPFLTRQILEPPVPPWRAPWANLWDMAQDTASVFSAYVVGQSVPAVQVWFWAGLAVLLFVVYYDYAKYIAPPLLPGDGPDRTPAADRQGLMLWLPLYVLIPPLTIFAVSAAAIPIFHIRYLSTYAPAFALIAAAGLVFLFARHRVLFGLLVIMLTVGGVYSLARFWQLPEYRPDDHRTAVARLAHDWRPGDAILANAGWIYTALDTYWPATLAGPDDALPAGPIAWLRLTDVQALSAEEERDGLAGPASHPRGFKTGSIDGSPSLGWGAEDADFYAMSRDDTIASLEAMGSRFARILHYRLYDTVNDPDALIRDWLASNLTLRTDETFSGNGFLRLEQYSNNTDPGWTPTGPQEDIQFESALALEDYQLPEVVPAGSYLYLPAAWRAAPESTALDAPLAASLRLVDSESMLWAQHDEPLDPPAETWNPDELQSQVLALPIPASTPPGEYNVQLVLYRQDNLQPLPADTADGSADAVNLGTVQVGLPESVPIVSEHLTRFDYLELVQAGFTPGRGAPKGLPALAAGQPLQVDLVWRPMPSDYKDAYVSRVILEGQDGTVAAAWEQPLGRDDYPSSMWPARFPVRDQFTVIVPEGIEEGVYRVLLEVHRSSDGLRIPSRPRRWRPITKPAYELGTITISE